LEFTDRTLDIGYRRQETGHEGDFILCPMLLCSAMDRQKQTNAPK